MRDEAQVDLQRLNDILDAIAAIARHKPGNQETLSQDELVLVWMAHHMQIIGEASSRLSPGFKAAHPEQPWRKIIGMRDAIVHNYSKVDPDEVWAAIDRDVPQLKEFVVKVLADMETGEGLG